MKMSRANVQERTESAFVSLLLYVFLFIHQSLSLLSLIINTLFFMLRFMLVHVGQIPSFPSGVTIPVQSKAVAC